MRAFCPHIYGNTAIKAGILLALFGGVHKQLGRDTAHRDGGVPEDEQVPLRGDIHVLLVGDPGLGKSQASSETARGGGEGGAARRSDTCTLPQRRC